jgi:signal transduction histidine kinase
MQTSRKRRQRSDIRVVSVLRRVAPAASLTVALVGRLGLGGQAFAELETEVEARTVDVRDIAGRERAGLLGGQLTVESAPAAGARVTAELPLGGSLERRAAERGA